MPIFQDPKTKSSSSSFQHLEKICCVQLRVTPKICTIICKWFVLGKQSEKIQRHACHVISLVSGSEQGARVSISSPHPTSQEAP